jgi:hypothetical protein
MGEIKIGEMIASLSPNLPLRKNSEENYENVELNPTKKERSG